ncbi:tapasin-related protein isoform X3 [Pleurodeles waltl]|uniref:tapasin-related protein isoform X3 n=1 Tax=Pleurodeles waltl TaxID=8319 RepID=UPI003709BCDA
MGNDLLSMVDQSGVELFGGCGGPPPVLSTEGQREVDLVLDCMFLEEKAGHLGGFASGFSHDSATLVLPDVMVTDGEYLNDYTDYNPQDIAEDAIIFEGRGATMGVAEAETVLHADCNGQEVTCEISRYFAPSKPNKMKPEQKNAGLEKVEVNQDISRFERSPVDGQQEEMGTLEEMTGLEKEEARPEFKETELIQEITEIRKEEVGLEPEEEVLEQKEPTHSSSWFIFYIQIPNGNVSITIVTKTVPDHNQGDGQPRLHPRLKVPLSDKGIIPVLVDLSVFTRTPSLITSIGNTVRLDCGLLSPSLDATAVEWRIQHQGSGRTIHEHSPGPEARKWPTRTRIDPQLLLDLGDASLTIADVGVKDEGTYICLITTPSSHAQQIIQLFVQEPPRVTLSVLPHPDGPVPKTVLTCDIARYFPLDVQVHWTRNVQQDSLTDGQEISESYSSSHRHNQDDTFSISSSIEVLESDLDKGGEVYTCSVSHISLKEPFAVRVSLEPRGATYILGACILPIIIMLLVITGYMIFKLRNQDRAPVVDAEGQKPTEPSSMKCIRGPMAQ